MLVKCSSGKEAFGIAGIARPNIRCCSKVSSSNKRSKESGVSRMEKERRIIESLASGRVVYSSSEFFDFERLLVVRKLCFE